jgi:hypothetical protein
VSDFYDDDEPLEEVTAAFGAGPHGLTAPPEQQWVSDPSLPITCTLSMTTVGTPVFMGRAMVPSPYFTR